MSQVTDSSSFGTLRSFLWPIHTYELKKFLPMQLMLILICFNYSTLRNLKDSIVITTSGAEVIPFIKVWVLLPMAVILTLIFAKLTNRYSQERVFYIMLSGFLVFFAVFAFILYPLRDTLHPHETAKSLEAMYPACKWIIALCHNWIFTSFYVMSELWGVIILQVSFWGLANEVTRIYEARRFYSVFSIGSNIAAAMAGLCAVLFISSDDFFNVGEGIAPLDKDAAWETKLTMLVTVIILCGFATMAIFRWMNKMVLNDPSYEDLHKNRKGSPKTKNKLSLRESFTYLSNSKYLICIAIMVVSYNLTINLVEIVWKDQLRQLYPTKSEYMTYISYLTLSMGICSTLTSFFMAKIISRFGWTWTALITPFIMLATCTGFFTFMFFREHLAGIMLALTGTTPLAIAVFFGSAQNCLSKAAKYSVFDATQNMAFIPLSHEVKLKGKAAIDGIGSRLGKSGGSIIHGGLLMIFHTLSNSSPYVAGILLLVIFFWIGAVKSLGKQFGEVTGQQPEPSQTRPVLQPVKAEG